MNEKLQALYFDRKIDRNLSSNLGNFYFLDNKYFINRCFKTSFYIFSIFVYKYFDDTHTSLISKILFNIQKNTFFFFPSAFIFFKNFYISSDCKIFPISSETIRFGKRKRKRKQFFLYDLALQDKDLFIKS